MNKNLCAIVFLLYFFENARALDIPMNGRLADESLDSKTCFGTIFFKNKLVGYELGDDLLISIEGRLVALSAAPNIIDSEYGKFRVYVKNGVSVSIIQKSYKKKSNGVDFYEVYERSVFFISENGKGKFIMVSINSSCSP